MHPISQTLRRDIEQLKQLRDELRVQAHLGRAEVRDTWSRLERLWPKVESRVRDLESEADSARDHIFSATRALVEELRQGYQQLSRHRE